VNRELIEQQLERLERPQTTRAPVLPWLLVAVGLLAVIGTAIHGYIAYTTIDRVNVSSRIDTPNPVVLFQDAATNGPRVGSTVEANSRAAYTRALEQFILDGTGLCLGLVVVLAGVFVRANQ